MSLPKTTVEPDDPERLPRARRRRARRSMGPLGVDERERFIRQMAYRVTPSVDFFLFSILSGLILGAGLGFDQIAFLIGAALTAPLMAPLIGISLGTAVGSITFFVRSILGLALGAAFFFLTGMLAGYITFNILPTPDSFFFLARFHARLSWVNILVLVVGVLLTAYWLARDSRRAMFPSSLAAYTLLTPLSVAGFGLTTGQPHLWPDGLVVFSLYLSIAVLVGAAILTFMGYRPPRFLGFSFWGAMGLAGVIILVFISGAGYATRAQVGIPTYTPTVTLTPSLTPTLTPTNTSTVTPSPTLTPTLTPTPTRTLTPTPVPPTATPRPVLAAINVPTADGARIRNSPGGTTLKIYPNGTVVEILPEQVEVNGILWVHVLGPDGEDGWMVAELLDILTPQE